MIVLLWFTDAILAMPIFHAGRDACIHWAGILHAVAVGHTLLSITE